MFEYGLINRVTEESEIIFGYDLADAFRRSKLDSKEWVVYYSQFID